MHEEDNKDLFTDKMIKNHMKFCRNNKKVDDQFYMNAVEGIKKWASAKCTMDNVDDITNDNKIIALTMNVSPKKCHVGFTTKNLLKLFDNELVVACCDSTCECAWNRWPIHIVV